MFAPLLSEWRPTKGSHQAGGSAVYKDYQRNMMSKGKLPLRLLGGRTELGGSANRMDVFAFHVKINGPRQMAVCFLTIYPPAP